MKNHSNNWVENYKKVSSNAFIKKSEIIRFKLLNFFQLVSKKAEILDIGCGSGGSLKTLNNLGYENLYGLDIENMIDPNYDFIKFIRGDISQKNKIQDNKFDVVYTIGVLHHLKNETILKLALVEINRILKKNGYVFHYEPSNNIFSKLERYFFAFKPLHLIPLIKAISEMIVVEKDTCDVFKKNIKFITPFYKKMEMKAIIDKIFLHRHIWCFQKLIN